MHTRTHAHNYRHRHIRVDTQSTLCTICNQYKLLYLIILPSCTKESSRQVSSPWASSGRQPIQGMALVKLHALVYDILPSTTAVFSHAIGSRKLSANEHFFVGAQTVVSLLQTTQIKQRVSFIVANKVYTSTNKTIIV